MAEYVSAQALLADVRLRLDGHGRGAAALVVEGFDDKRLFYHRVVTTAEVVPAGGKRLLRAGLNAMLDDDKGRILFLTDCDYDVLNGTLHGGPDIIITGSCDVEADLISLGILEKVVVEVIPGTVETRGAAMRVAADVRGRAELIALPLGRIRIAAQPLGVDLELEDMDLAKYWNKSAGEVLTDKLATSIFARLKRGGVSLSKAEWLSLIDSTPNDVVVCNGKDLIAAAQMIMRVHYKMNNRVSAEMLTSMMRLAVDDSHFQTWSVVQRIHKWEERSGSFLLAAAA
jgi:hypothetical protein